MKFIDREAWKVWRKLAREKANKMLEDMCSVVCRLRNVWTKYQDLYRILHDLGGINKRKYSRVTELLKDIWRTIQNTCMLKLSIARIYVKSLRRRNRHLNILIDLSAFKCHESGKTMRKHGIQFRNSNQYRVEFFKGKNSKKQGKIHRKVQGKTFRRLQRVTEI